MSAPPSKPQAPRAPSPSRPPSREYTEEAREARVVGRTTSGGVVLSGPGRPPREEEPKERKVTHAERVWLAFATAAVGGFASIDGFTNDAEVEWQATKLADRMTSAWRARFEPPPPLPDLPREEPDF